MDFYIHLKKKKNEIRNLTQWASSDKCSPTHRKKGIVDPYPKIMPKQK